MATILEMELGEMGDSWGECWIDMNSIKRRENLLELDVYYTGRKPDEISFGWFGWYSYKVPVLCDHIVFEQVLEVSNSVSSDEVFLLDVHVSMSDQTLIFSGTQGSIAISSLRKKATVERRQTDEIKRISGFKLFEYSR